jgi:hypothetical protein
MSQYLTDLAVINCDQEWKLFFRTREALQRSTEVQENDQHIYKLNYDTVRLKFMGTTLLS